MEAASIHLRTRTYLSLLLLAAAIAVVIAFATLAFLGAYLGLHDLLWEELPHALGIGDPYSWYALVVTTLGGLTVGVLLRILPGHGGPGPADGHGIGMEQIPLSHTAGVVVVSLVSLTAGASLGPEAALLAVALALGSVLAARLKRAELDKVFGMSGVGSLLSGLFGSPLAPTVLALEVAPVTGRNLYVFLVPVLVASAVGLLVFNAVLNGPLLDIALPAYNAVDAAHVLEALAVAAVAAAVGLLLIGLLRVLRLALAPIAERTVLKATLGGVGIGVIALVAGKETLFSGEHELEVLLDDPAAYGAGTLLLILAGKVLALAISLETGFRGGRIFPVLFIGATVGFLTSELFERVPLAVAVACGMAGAGVAIMRLPVFIALMVAFFASPTTIPLIVLACVVGYVLTFDKPELGGPAREEERRATPEDLQAATP
ncbi:MAG TPA: chloride channel protein [Gaiellaceae bacterium]|nr:chloride channel protein [Gaiellaceae bacterium]